MRTSIFVVWPRSFLDAAARLHLALSAAKEPPGSGSTESSGPPSLVEPHFLPRSLELKDQKFREALERLEDTWGITEVWWQVTRKRLRSGSSSSPEAEDTAALQDSIQRIVSAFDWPAWVPPEAHLTVTAECQKSALRNAKRLRDLVSHALASQHPSPASNGVSIPVKASVFRDTLTIYLPLLFEPWTHRCYKKDLSHPASLREDYAQSIIGLLAEWRGVGIQELPTRLYAPFAGSGTLIFEYITLRWRLGHALVSKTTAVERSPAFPRLTWEHLLKRARERVLAESQASPLWTMAVETDPRHCLTLNTAHASFADVLPEGARSQWKNTAVSSDFFEVDEKEIKAAMGLGAESGRMPHAEICVLMNPPFGERLAGIDAVPFYGKIGKTLAKLSKTLDLCGAILCPSETAARAVTLAINQQERKTVTKSQSSNAITTAEVPFSYGTLDAKIVFFRRKKCSEI